MIECEHCHLTCEEKEFAYVDKDEKGFWCDNCDGYTYYEEEMRRHKFKLILEDKKAGGKINNKSDIKFSKRMSVFRYPGGKSKVIDYLYTRLQEGKTKKLVSPYTGGGSFELALLEAGVVDELHLNDFDTGIFSVWWLIKHMPFSLIQRIETEIPTHKDYFAAQQIIKKDYIGVDMVDAAWAALLVNRLAFSGVYKANPLGGKKGNRKKLLSRWNPKELIKRIERIYNLSDRIEITQCNAIELIEEAYWENEVTIFIDPPYVEKGRDLYHCYYNKEDHQLLAGLLDNLYFGFPGADIIVTYDYNKWLEEQYWFPETEIINRNYSI